MNNRNNVEILAPAGSFESLKAAINAGCDAVYMGGRMFGARAYADNPDVDGMIEAIKYTHLYGKKIYMTVNTLLKEKELFDNLYEYILPYYNAGLDAVIVQDYGVMKYIHDNFPGLSIHGSTQMTLTSHLSVNLLKNYGVDRIVTPRELNLDEIRSIKDNTGLDVEVFIHGALCYCYSGQCLMSSMIGGRSGNRGRCAQPCRKEYTINNKKGYFLSPKDLCTIPILPEIIEAGADSLKIEGRMKKTEYTALVVSMYRKYLDLYNSIGKEEYIKFINNNNEYSKDMVRLSDIYNRGGFTNGYFNVHNGKSLMSMDRPNHNGTLVGRVLDIKNNHCTIQLSEEVYAQDVLEIRESYSFDKSNSSRPNKERTKNSYEFTLKNGCASGKTITTPFSKGVRIIKGQQVYRIRNQQLITDINEKYILNNKKITMTGTFKAKKNEPIVFTLSVKDNCYKEDVSVTLRGSVPDLAVKQSILVKDIEKQLKKINNTEFVYEELNITLDEGLFIPVGVLNNIRRDAIEKLKQAIIDVQSYGNAKKVNSGKIITKSDANYSKQDKDYDSTVAVSITRMDSLDIILEYDFVKRIYIDMSGITLENVIKGIDIINSHNQKATNIIETYIMLPHIFRLSKLEQITKQLSTLAEKSSIKGFVVRNTDEIELIKKIFYKCKIIGDYNLYVMNSNAINTYMELGADELSASLESNKNELRDVAQSNIGVRIYGYSQIMISAGCLQTNSSKCNKNNEMLILKGSYDDKYYVKCFCNSCYNIIYDSAPVNLITYVPEIKKMGFGTMRIDFTIEDNKAIRDIMQSLSEKKNNANGYYGHYFKGVE